MKNFIAIAIAVAMAVVFIIAYTTNAQISSPNYWKKLTTPNIVPINNTWSIGSSSIRIPTIWATDVDINGTLTVPTLNASTTNIDTANIGTVAVNGFVNGDLVIGGIATSTITGDGTPSTIGSDLVINGNVGIGTTNPSSKLEIQGGDLVVGGIATTTITGNGAYSIFGGDIQLQTGGMVDLADGTSMVYVSSNGNSVLIGGGTTIPVVISSPTQNAQLDVGLITVGLNRTYFFPDQSGTFGIFSSVPTASTTPCVVGEFAATSTYIYVCVSPNQWTRATSTINW